MKKVLLIGELSKRCSVALNWATEQGLIAGYSVYNPDLNVDNIQDWIVMKGYIHTEDFLRIVISFAKSICQKQNLPKKLLTHCGVFKNKDTGMQFILTDAACIPCPDSFQRTEIIHNAKKLHSTIHGECVCNISLLSAGGDTNSNTNPELFDWWQTNKGDFAKENINLRLEQLDVALNAEIRKFKGVPDEISDVIVCSDINQGNCIWKCLTALSNDWLCAGILMGATFPIIINSRGDTTESMQFSLEISTR